MRILVTGRQGQLARSLLEAGEGVSYDIVALGRPELDVSSETSVDAALTERAFDAVINTAAYTNVEHAESEPDNADLINRAGAANVAKAAHRLSIPLLHISTDYVFDGRANNPVSEDVKISPISVYGRTKRDGEIVVAKHAANYIILRTSWIYSPFGRNFVRTMLALAAERDSVSVVNDQIGSPTSALDLATFVLRMLDFWLAPSNDTAALSGTYHLSASGHTHWAGFAKEIFRISSTLGGPTATVMPVSSKEFGAKAARPAYSVLDTSKAERIFGIRMPDWQASLQTCVKRILDDD